MQLAFQRAVDRAHIGDLHQSRALGVVQPGSGKSNRAVDRLHPGVAIPAVVAILRMVAVVRQMDRDPFERPFLAIRIHRDCHRRAGAQRAQ